MRIVSLVPHATELLYALGCGNELIAVTHECDHPAAARDLPALTRDSLPRDLDAAGITELHTNRDGIVRVGDEVAGIKAVLSASERRKMLRQSLKSLGVDPLPLLGAAGIEPTARAEEISIEGFVALAKAFNGT